MTRPYDRLKRLLDLVISSFAIVLTLPVQAAVAGIIAVKLGRPVLFRQQRPGLHGETFELIKFRSMKPPRSEAESDEERMTPFGAALRSTSLDELPTLWNVFRGDMSLVGPRPLLTAYLDRYTQKQARRHEVRPGITGLAQVNGRNALDWEERLELDVRYVDDRSFRLDAQILLKTFLTVVRREGIAAEGHVTMAEFLGTEDARGT